MYFNAILVHLVLIKLRQPNVFFIIIVTYSIILVCCMDWLQI